MARIRVAGNGSSGRRPQPTALRVLRGNPGKRPVNRQEPQPTPGVPSCPSFLTAEAKREWRRIASELVAVGLIALTDRAALAAYCQSWARYQEAEREITRDGQTYAVREILELRDGTQELVTLSIKPHPAVAISLRERQVMKAYLIEFGLSPSSRSRLKAPEKQPVDPFAELSG